MEILLSLFNQLPALAGFAAVFAVIINLGKVAGIVKEGQSDEYSAGANLLLLVGLFVARVTHFNGVPGLDANSAYLANLGAIVLQFIVSLGFTGLSHGALTAIPLVNKTAIAASFSRGTVKAK